MRLRPGDVITIKVLCQARRQHILGATSSSSRLSFRSRLNPKESIATVRLTNWILEVQSRQTDDRTPRNCGVSVTELRWHETYPGQPSQHRRKEIRRRNLGHTCRFHALLHPLFFRFLDDIFIVSWNSQAG